MSLPLVTVFPEVFWFNTKNIYGQSIFSYVKASNLSQLDSSILVDLLSRFPFVLIITKSEIAKQNRTSFESKSFLLEASFLLTLANNPYVSTRNIPSHPEKCKFENLKKVPYTPFVHLPSLVPKSHPNKKLRRVDLPELWGPKVVITTILSFWPSKDFFKMLFGISNKSPSKNSNGW